MGQGRANAIAVVLVCGLLSGMATAGPLYRCNANGATYLTDKPCAGASFGAIGALSPSREAAQYASRAPNLSRAPDHQQYLGSTCASLSDAIRTAPARGVGYQTQAELRTEYAEKCSEEDAAARRRLSEDRNAQREQRQADARAEQTQREREQVSREQCSELLRVLHERRKRIDTLSVGERSDLQRSEANYRDRCKA